MRETARDFIRDEAGMGTVEIICKSLYAKHILLKESEKRCVYKENGFCILKNGKYAKYAK